MAMAMATPTLIDSLRELAHYASIHKAMASARLDAALKKLGLQPRPGSLSKRENFEAERH
jgi:hypothetical protein